MKRLRKHQPVDSIDNQKRATGVRWSRMIYLGMLSAFSFSLIYYMVGDRVVLSLEGTVLRDRNAVDAAYVGRVADVFVKEGQGVEEGDPLVRIESIDMVARIAEMRFRIGELGIRREEILGRLRSIETMMPLAARAAEESRQAVARIDSVDRGVVSSIRRTDALRGNVDAAGRQAELETQQQTAMAEFSVIAEALEGMQAALEQLERIHDGGFVRATIPGVVGARVPLTGQVVELGDELMTVNGGASYLLAYLPDQYLFKVAEGMAVQVDGAGRSVRGEVEEILAVADALPAEFQNLFRPQDRSRLVRVKLPDDQPFAVTQKVSVHGCVFGYCWVR